MSSTPLSRQRSSTHTKLDAWLVLRPSSDGRWSPGQNGAGARIGGRFRDQLAGVAGRAVDEDGSAYAAKPPRPSVE